MKHILCIFSLLFLFGCEKEPNPVQIAVSTEDATHITTNSASVQVSMDPNDIINEVGVYCSTDSLFNSSTVNKSSTQEIIGTTFNFQLSNLSAGTQYFYKAYASGKSNSIYGLTKSFMTEKIQLTTSIDSISANDKEGTYKVEVLSNTDWSVSSDQNWCVVSPDAGSKQGTISLQLQANTSTSARQAKVIVSAGGQTQQIIVDQRGCDENLSVSSNYFSVSPENGSYDFTIYTNGAWNISCDQSWCRLSSSSGKSESTLSFTVSENVSALERTAKLTIVAGTLTQEINIVQQSRTAILTVSSNAFSVDATKNSYTFAITSNMNWTVASDQSWCAISTPTGSNNGTVSFSVSENTSASERVATILVTSGNVRQQIKITQAGQSKTLTVSRNSFTFGPERGSGEFSIISNTSWTVSSDQTWCNVSLSSGSNNKTISFTLAANTSTQSRVAIIRVETSSKSIQVTVVQEGMTTVIPNLSVFPESLSVTASDQTSSFSISSNTNWSVSSDQIWCVPSLTSGNGDKTITLSFSKNESSTKRTAIILVQAGSLSSKITVNQTGLDISLSVSTESLSADFKSQTLNFDISSNTNWTVSSDQTWCVPSVVSGNGNKTINCSISENVQSQSRTASMIVSAGNLSKTVTVTQKGKDVKIVNIPDANFKAYLVENFDTDGDGEISEEEALAIETIACEAMNIKSLEGIDKMINISILRCDENNLKELDVSNNNNLWNLSCDKNNLTRLILGNQPRINGIWCAFNQLESIDISNCKRLRSITCYQNDLIELDVSLNLELIFISCDDNKLSSIDVSNNQILETLQCGGNEFTTIDTQYNLKLKTFSVFHCDAITSLDVSKNTNLEYFDCRTLSPHIDVYLKTGQVIERGFEVYDNVTVYYKD